MSPRRGVIRWIVQSSLNLRFLVVAVSIVLMVLGFTSLSQMRVDVFPEFAPPRVVIQTACVGLSTSDVEELVTVPLEQGLNGLQGLDDMRSKSVPQLSSIELLFSPDTDLLHARQLVQERLAIVSPTLPTWAAPPVMLAPVSATGRAMQIGMTSKKNSLIEMSLTAYWNIRTRLLQVPGVANVAIWNERLQLMNVQVEPARMAGKGVSLDQVMETTADAVDSGLLRFSSGSVIGTGGMVETANQRLSVRNVLPIVTPADLAKVPVKGADKPTGGGRPPTLGDVAVVTQTHQPLIGDAVVNSEPGILLVVEKLPWANTLELTSGVEAAIAQLQPGLPDVKFDTHVFQQADFVKLAISNLSQSLLLGFLLVVAVLMLFLFEWRVALISLLTIPLSLVATLLVLHLAGATINTMTLAGLVIALGAVVDDAIIDAENIVRRLRERRLSGSSESTASVILHASLEVRSPIVYATLIIVAAAIPVFLLQGLTGAFFRPLAVSYTLAIVASMVVALTLTPALCLILLRSAPIERRTSPVVRWLQRGYVAALGRIVVRPRGVYAAAAVVTVLGAFVGAGLGQSLFPAFQERDFLMHWVGVPGTSVAETARTTTAVSKQIRAVPGVRSFGAHIGQALLGEEVFGVNFGENWISLDPSADYTKARDQIDAIAATYPGLFAEVQTYLDERVEEVLTGGKEPIIIRVYGEDLKVLRSKSAEVLKVLASIPGVKDAHTDISQDVPQVEVRVKLGAAEKVGLKPGDVRRAAATLVAGEEVGDIFRAGRAYDVVVWSTPQTRSDVTALEQLPIDTPSGARVKLKDVADVSVKPNPNAIERQGDSRRLDVGAGVEGRDLGSVVNELNAKLAGVSFPRGYHAEVLGEYQERQTAQSRLLSSAVAAGVLILLLLQTSFRSWRLAILVFLTLPMALVGGVLAAWMAGGILSLGSLVGFFTVFGIAARNGILLINHYQHLEQEEGMEFGLPLVIRGAKERLAPILMTTLATGLALVPLVVLGSRPGHEIEHPLAVVILGGLVTSTLLSLFVVPSIYLRFHRPLDKPAPVAGTEGEAHAT
ncbi:efflux RND transporter permease subunit [Terrabacter terrae]|uniref:Efflux RND transporter permease subunit n=1 Tax=Terrabacter terrae TaxID=318434 RepID=A0ABN2TUZ0_9MICO